MYCVCVCVRVCFPLQLLKELTDFHKTQLDGHAIGGHLDTTPFKSLVLKSSLHKYICTILTIFRFRMHLLNTPDDGLWGRNML
jgi:hypothetical protein